MANETPISYIKIGEDQHPIDAVTLNGKSDSDFQEGGKIVQSLSGGSKTDEIPSAALMWDIIGDIEARLSNI